MNYSDPEGIAPFTAQLTAILTAFAPNPPLIRHAAVPLLSTLCDIPNPNLAFVFDTTGSMGSYIGTVQQTAKDILNKLDVSGLNYRVAVTDYKDFGGSDYPYRPVLPFSSNQAAITSAINSLSSVSGGGDTPESAYSALIRTIQGEGIGEWEEDAYSRSIILLTDAPPHDPETYTGYTAEDVIAAARFANVGTGNPLALSSTQTMSPFSSASANMFAVEQATDANSNEDTPPLVKRLYPIRIFTILAGGNTWGAEFYEKIAKETLGKVYYTSSANDITKALFDITGTLSGGGDSTVKVPENSPVIGLLVMGTLIAGMAMFKRKRNSLDVSD
ncbi:vWA domain-containing protein [Chlorogloeopsis sp. ULAP02]